MSNLYRELAIHRVQEAIEILGRTPAPCLPARSARALERAAGALACITAVYATPGGELAERWQTQIDQLVAAAASLEQLADFCRCQTPHSEPQGGQDAQDL